MIPFVWRPGSHPRQNEILKNMCNTRGNVGPDQIQQILRGHDGQGRIMA